MSFMRDCRAILDACEGRPADTPEPEDTPSIRLPVSNMSFIKNVRLPTPPDEAEESVSFAADLLSSNRSDSNMLGMESLASLTDPAVTDKFTAVLSSKRILCTDENVKKPFDLHNCVMSLVIYGNETDRSAGVEESAIEDHSEKLRTLAMRSLSNALALLCQEGFLCETIAPCKEWYVNVLVPRLLEDLNKASDHPHDACYSVRCLSSLASSSPVFARKIKDLDGLLALKDAEQVGKHEFSLLARDAGMCHNSVLSCCG